MDVNDVPNIPPEIKEILSKKQSNAEQSHPSMPKEVKMQKPIPEAKGNVYEFVLSLVQNDVLELFGETGSGKTTFSLIFSHEAAELGKKVLFIDTERNLIKKPEWCDYVYMSRYSEILNFVKKLPETNYDVVIIDSIGMPVLGHFALMNMKERGEALLGVQAILYSLKVFCHDDPERMALITNQPESEFGKTDKRNLRPFGDKGQFFTKEIWKTRKIYSKPNETRIEIETFRSRHFGMGRKIAEMTISDRGVVFKGMI